MLSQRQPHPLFSVVTPVLREADRVNALVDHIRMAGYGVPLEIILVDGDPAGSTLAALSRDGVTGLLSPKGRAKQLNAGAEAASGDNLLFLHADTRLPAGAFQAAAKALDGQADAGAFSLSIRSKNPLLRLIAAGATLRSRLFSLPYGDQAQFIRRDLFEAMGGYPDVPIMEDVAFMRALSRAGARIEVLRAHVTTSARRWRTEGVLRTTARNLTLLALYFCGVSPARLARYYPSMPELDHRRDR